MARCKACGTEAPAMARFCSICGATVAAASPSPAAAPRPTAPPSVAPRVPQAPASGYAAPAPQVASGSSSNNGKKALVIGSGLLLLGTAGFLFARSSGLLGVAPTALPQSQVLTAPNTNPATGPVLGAPQVDAPKSQPVLAQPPPASSAMPEDIIAYLRWLKALNQNLQTMHSDTVSMSTGMLTTLYGDIANMASETEVTEQKPNTSATVQKLQKIVMDLNQVTATFQGRTPPNPCAPLATEYNTALKTTVSQTAGMAQTYTKLINALAQDSSQGTSSAQELLPSLMQELNGGMMSKGADAGFNSADTALNQLRDRYTQIPSDIAPGAFQLKSLDTGFDPKSLLRGMPGAGGGFGM